MKICILGPEISLRRKAFFKISYILQIALLIPTICVIRVALKGISFKMFKYVYNVFFKPKMSSGTILYIL